MGRSFKNIMLSSLHHVCVGQQDNFYGWNEPVITNAPVEDEVVEAVLGMNQNHILPTQIYIYFPASTVPQNIFLLPTYLLPLTYLPPPTFNRHC